jgi:hypothetical protein
MIDQATCPYCRKPVDYEWDNGFISSPNNVLVADWVFHAECWSKIEDAYNQESAARDPSPPAQGDQQGFD